jgi:hypothetical protein
VTGPLLVYAGYPNWHRRGSDRSASWVAWFGRESEALDYSRSCKEIRPDAAVFVIEQEMVRARTYTNSVCCELDCVDEPWRLHRVGAWERVNTPMCEGHAHVELQLHLAAVGP